MGFKLFPMTTGLTGLIITATTFIPLLPTPAIAESSMLLAQAAETYAPVGCRITREQIGVYQEPNLDEAALGILAKEVTITLGTGSGNGWARIVAPQTGWVQAKFLRGDSTTPCPMGQSPLLSSPTTSDNQVASEPVSDSASPMPTQMPGVVSRAVCAVLPEAGLIVRDQPNLTGSRVIGSIRSGNYTFQFTRDRRTTGQLGQQQRQWAYITAPAKGWVSTGIVGDGSNLAGEGCS